MSFSTPTFTKLSTGQRQPKEKLQTEFYQNSAGNIGSTGGNSFTTLRIKYGYHEGDLHKTHACSTRFCNALLCRN